MAVDMYNRIFVFSQTQADEKKSIEGKSTKFGSVIVNGVSKQYTSIALDLDQVRQRYPDAKKLIEGDIRHIRYTEPLE